VEGIQAQTKFLMALLMKLGIPTIIFVNKIMKSICGFLAKCKKK